jgi:hypothetical protein
LTSHLLHEVVIILLPDQLERRGEFLTAFPITGGELERRGEFLTAFPITGGEFDYSGAAQRCLSADQPARGMNRASPD